MGWLSDVYGANPAVKLLIDPATGRILDANDAAAAFYGWSVEELSTLSVQQINTLDPAEVARELERAREGNRTFFRFDHRLRNGDIRHVEVYTGPVVVDGKICLLSIIHDVTDRERAIENLNRVQRMDAVGRVAGGVAHDFNNLLFVILGAADTLSRHAGSLDHFVRNVDRIREATLRAADLTRQLLLVSRGHEARGERLDVSDVVREILELVGGTLEGRIDVSVTLERDLAAMIPRSSIDQVLLNLIVNARDAMPAGGPLAVHADEIELPPPPDSLHPNLPQGRYVRVRVKDGGVGMPPDVVAKAFEPFFTTKEPGKGTGLGLSTAYGIVRRARGSIEIESAVGQGTTVTFLLPRAEEPAVPRTPPPPSREIPSKRGARTVLLVEDQRVIRELVEQTLKEAGYRVLPAAGATEALAVAEQHLSSVDLLLTDVVMPKMRGPELAARLRRLRPSLPVLFMSGYTGDALDDDGLDPCDLLEKPFGGELLLSRIESALERVSAAAAPAVKR